MEQKFQRVLKHLKKMCGNKKAAIIWLKNTHSNFFGGRVMEELQEEEIILELSLGQHIIFSDDS